MLVAVNRYQVMINILKKVLIFSALILFGLGLGTQNIHAEKLDKFGAEVTSPFGRRNAPTAGASTYHKGIDLGLEEGTKIPAPADGTIEQGYQSGFGNWLVLHLRNGDQILMAHLNDYAVSDGASVRKGDVIAYSGNTGRSTGPHLHLEYHVGHYDPDGSTVIDPYNFLTKIAGWDLSGNYTPEGGYGSDDGVFGKLRKIIPRIDFDYTTYFSPSDRLLEATYKIIELIKNSFDRWQPAILNLLYLLMIIDLAWFSCQSALKGELQYSILFPKIIRYGFFVLLAKKWKEIIDNIFIPFFENLSSTMTGDVNTVETFLNFSTLFDTIKRIMANNMHPEVTLVDAWYQMFPFVILNLLNWVILLIVIALMLWVMYKVISFYIVCSFGILGIPINFIPKIGNKGNMMIGVIISSLFDLILTSILLNLLNSQLSTLGVISSNSVPDVFMFAGVFFFLASFITKLSTTCCNFFSGLL